MLEKGREKTRTLPFKNAQKKYLFQALGNCEYMTIKTLDRSLKTIFVHHSLSIPMLNPSVKINWTGRGTFQSDEKSTGVLGAP